MRKYIDAAINLRKVLHLCPEESMKETKTKQVIKDFLSTLPNIEVVDKESWILGIYHGTSDRKVAFRADFDAVKDSSGKLAHLCGHDGHTAVLCGFASYINDAKPSDTIYFVFQPAEETGEGSALILPFLLEQGVNEIYGFHNIPEAPLGAVLLRKGTFAMASTGLEIKLVGAASHAAYPENGMNPSELIAMIILCAQDMLNKPHEGLLLSTVIGVDIGGTSYGVSPGQGILRLTIRGEHEEEFEKYLKAIKNYALGLAVHNKFIIFMNEVERFPATVNSDEGVKTLVSALEKSGIKVLGLRDPFRWSEDFGLYLTKLKGAFFGIGAGEDCPPLHTAGYEFPDDVIPYGIETFKSIIEA